MPARPLQPHHILHRLRLQPKPLPNRPRHARWFPRRQTDHIPPDLLLHRHWRIARRQLPPVQDRQPRAPVPLIHQMRRQQNRHPLIPLNLGKQSPKVDPRRRIQPGTRLIQQQNLRPMQQPLGDLHPPPHPPRKPIHAFPLSIQQIHPLQQPIDSPRQFLPIQPIKPPLLPKILFRRQLLIETRRLKHHPDMPSHRIALPRQPIPQNLHLPRLRRNQRRENPKQRRLPAPIRPQKSKYLPPKHLKRKIAQRRPIPIPMAQPLNLNNRLLLPRIFPLLPLSRYSGRGQG